MRRGWVSYPLGGGLLVLMGFFVVPSVSGVFELRGFGDVGRRTEGFYNAFFADCLFLVICAFLAVNAFSANRAPYSRRDALSCTLPLLGGLPVPAGSVVGSRVISMLCALVVGAPAFFGPLFFLSDLGELGTSYLWFAGIWVGYCLLASGLWLLCELTLESRVYTRVCFALAASLVVALVLLESIAEPGLVGRTVELVRDYGPLPAILSILAGAAAFALLARLSVRRIQVGDLSA